MATPSVLYHVHGEGHWQVEGVEGGLPLDNGSIGFYSEVGKVYCTLWRRCCHVQTLANHRLHDSLLETVEGGWGGGQQSNQL